MTTSDAAGTPAGPYAAAALTYHAAGWAPLPLPPRAKKHPPEGFTGSGGAWPSYPDVYAWTEDETTGAGNVALRLPPNVIGIDVDAYGDKAGALVLDELESRLGALPATWRSTSRDDGTSGIRFYTIPEGLRWPGILGPGIEVIRHGHRYAVAAPSIHPDTERPYRWVTPDGHTAIHGVPHVPEDLPPLPDGWISHFTRGEVATDHDRLDLDDVKAYGWLTGRTVGPPCRRLGQALAANLADMPTAGRHEHMLSTTNRLVWLAGQGHAGILDTLAQAREAFLTAVQEDRGPGEAAAEWDRMVVGAVRLAAAAHPHTPPADPCRDPFADVRGLLPTKGNPWEQFPTSPMTGPSADTASGTAWPTPTPTSPPTSPELSPPADIAPGPGVAPSPVPTGIAPTLPPDDVGDASREVRSRLETGGAFILDIPEQIPAIWGDGEEILWAAGEALTICGPAGVGKTTLTGQVVRARIEGGDVLGYPVERTGSRILYLAMDRPRQIARALRRTLGDLPRETLDARLAVWPGPPIADVATHPATLLALVQLAGADTVVVDSIKDAAVGLSNDEVGAGYNRARQMCIAAGVEVIEQHHMVKRGEAGTAPTSLADLYGSVWIGAGSGSVVLLYGAAGDPIVSMRHLKSPSEEVGPYRLIHDHGRGQTEIWHEADLVERARLAGFNGITAKTAAQVIEQEAEPGIAAVEKARRRLDKLVDAGTLRAEGGSKGRGRTRTWFYVGDPAGILPPVDNPVDNSRNESVINSEDSVIFPHKRNPELNHGGISGDKTTGKSRKSRSGQNRRSENHGDNHGFQHAENHDPPCPSLGDRGRGSVARQTPIAGGRYAYDHETGQVIDVETGEVDPGRADPQGVPEPESGRDPERDETEGAP